MYVCIAGKHRSVASMDILAVVTQFRSNINLGACFRGEMETHNMKFEIKMKENVGKERTAC